MFLHSMNFKTWLSENSLLDESVVIEPYKYKDKTLDRIPKDDYEAIKKIALDGGWYPMSNKKVAYVARNDEDNKIVGMLLYSIKQIEGSDHTPVYDYDVAVEKEHRGSGLLGIKLIRKAEEYKKELEKVYGKMNTEVEVINPKLFKLLQSPQFGYKPVGSNGMPLLTKN